MNYMFEFEFLKNNINSYIHAWCKEREIDTVNTCGNVWADIYGTGEYRKMIPVHIADNTYEVYASDEVMSYRETGLSRIFPLRERAVQIHYPVRKVMVRLEDGFTFNTEVESPSRYLRNFFENAKFIAPDKREKKVAEFAVIA